MRWKIINILLGINMLCLLILISNSYAQKVEPNKGKEDFIQGEVLVKFKKNTQPDTVQSVIDEAGARIKKKARFVDIYLLSIPPHVTV